MKKQSFRIIPMLGLLLVTALISVHAQSQRSRINVPFSFVVGQRTLPAGEYSIGPNKMESRNVWVLQAETGKIGLLFTTNPVRANRTQEQTKLVFHRYQDQYFLSQVWTGGEEEGRELRVSQSEQELMLSGIQRETIVVSGSAESGN